jgi:hypothetical protein
MGGAGQIVEIDETVIGKIEGSPKHLKERHGLELAQHRLDAGDPRGIGPETTRLGTRPLVSTFASHGSVNHSEKEYVRREFFPDADNKVQVRKVHTNTVEGYYSIFKRGMKGVYQHCSEKHLHRYLAEFDFRYSNRIKLGVNDQERATRAIKGAEGKRLRQPRVQEIAP